MNNLTILPIYTVGVFADYSLPQSASDQTQATSDELKLSNEPNFPQNKRKFCYDKVLYQRTTNNEL